ncbi:MAG: hypothetical protein ACRBFS_08225 [Aureispira sp.]
MLKKLWNKIRGKQTEPQFYAQKIDTETKLPLEEQVDNMLLGFYGPDALQKMKSFQLKLDSKRFEYKGLSFETFNWTKNRENLEEHFISWSCDDYPIGISLNYFDLVPDLPLEGNIEVIRDGYWEHGIAMLKCDFTTIQEVLCLENLFKTVYEDHVVQYIAIVIIPFQDQSFVLKVFAEDYGSTGLRDTIITPFVCDNIMDRANATIYPYDDTKEGRMTIAENEEFDELLPFHHLTILRKIMPSFLESISFSEELKNVPSFYQ